MISLPSVRSRIATGIILLAGLTTAAIAHVASSDISGRWVINSSSPTGEVSSVATIKQDGNTLTGTIEIQGIGSAALSGSRNGDTVRYTFPLNVQGFEMSVGVNGILKDSVTMTGTVDLPEDMGSYPFTAKRETKGN